jgi:hypothetical protein
MLVFFVNPGRSYSVEITADREPFGGLSANIRLLRFGDSCPSGPGSLSPRDTRLLAPRMAQILAQTGTGARLSFTYPGTGVGGPADFVWIVIENTSAMDRQYTYSVSEITLFGAFYFNAADFDSFITLQNTTNDSVSGTVTLLDVGNPSTAFTSTFTIPANGSIVRSTRTVVGCTATCISNQGSIQVTHDGPPGALNGFVTTSSGSAPLAFSQPLRAPREAP